VRAASRVRLFRNATSQKHSLSFSGGAADNRITYRIGTTYAEQGYIVPNSNLGKTNITGRSTAQVNDWLQMDFVSVANDNGPNGWLPIRYKSRDEFFNLRDQYAYGYYTIEGRDITFGGSPDATSTKAVAQVAPGFELRSVERIFRGVCASCSKGRARGDDAARAGQRQRGQMWRGSHHGPVSEYHTGHA
jgi:hypothetical protein